VIRDFVLIMFFSVTFVVLFCVPALSIFLQVAYFTKNLRKFPQNMGRRFLGSEELNPTIFDTVHQRHRPTDRHYSKKQHVHF